MKKLILMRHAKSSWDDPKIDDFHRVLNEQGSKTAPRMGKIIKKNHLVPDLILSSTALRAEQTTLLVNEQLNISEDKIKKTANLYNTSVKEYLNTISLEDDNVNTLLLIGHNPSLEELIYTLTDERHTLSTSTVVLIELAAKTWKEINTSSKGKLINIWKPIEVI